MVSDQSVKRGRPRRRLTAVQKYEMFVSVLTGQATQRQAAQAYGVDRSTVVTACRTAMTISAARAALSCAMTFMAACSGWLRRARWSRPWE
jgi:transposase-like protein